MLTKINHEGKEVPAIILPETESIESVLRLRDQLIEVLSVVSMSDEAVRCMPSMTLYAMITLYRYMDTKPLPPECDPAQ